MALTKAKIVNKDTGDSFDCLFNPTEYTIAKTNSWQPRRNIGKNVPKQPFTGGGARTLTTELFFDVLEDPGADVRTHVDKLWALVMIDTSDKNPATQRSDPPKCIFQWGGNWSFQAVITSLSVRYTLFREDGIPARATANVTFTEAEDEDEQPGQNPTSFSEPGHKRREVRPHDTLAMIAYDEYGNAALWRKIADANEIDDPTSIRAGQVLAIPPIN